MSARHIFPSYRVNAAWVLLALLATAIGVSSLRYGLPTVPFPLLANFVTHRLALSIHAVFASIALLVGPWQFLPGIRARHLALHRVLGRIYAVAILIAWLASIPIGLHAQTGAVASAGFLTLGLCWIVATGGAVFKVLHGDVLAHRRWMIRSYALTAAAITLRLYLGLATATHLPFDTAYPIIAWLCWLPNLAVAEILVRRSGQVRAHAKEQAASHLSTSTL